MAIAGVQLGGGELVRGLSFLQPVRLLQVREADIRCFRGAGRGAVEQVFRVWGLGVRSDVGVDPALGSGIHRTVEAECKECSRMGLLGGSVKCLPGAQVTILESDFPSDPSPSLMLSLSNK